MSTSAAVRRSTVTAVLALALALPAGAHAAGGAYSVASNTAKKDQLLDIAAAFVPRAESTWVPDGSTPSCAGFFDIPETTGAHDACSDGVPIDRGVGAIAYIYATLLAGRPSAASFGGVNREAVADRLEQVLRYLAFTNDINEPGGWGGTGCSRVTEHCEAGITTFQLAWAYRTLVNDGVAADQLEIGTTAAAVEAVIAAEGNVSLGLSPMSGSTNNSFAEENSWESMSLAGARAALPGNANAAAWLADATDFGVNSQVRPEDRTNTAESVDGQTLATWTDGVRDHIFESDWTMTNHGFFHPLYSVGVMASLMDSALMLKGAGVTVPSAFTFRQQLIWDQVSKWLMLGDGDLLMPAGNDWVTHDYQFLPYLTTMAQQGDATTQTIATVLESRALAKIAQRQAENTGGSLYGLPRIGYEADVVRNLMESYWLHVLYPATTTPTESAFNAAYATTLQVKQLTAHETIVNRTPNGTVSLHWHHGGGGYPSLFITPAVQQHLDDPVMSHYWAGGGLGDTAGPVTHAACDCSANSFSSAGILTGSANRRFSVTSFKDGSTILLDVGTGNTFNMLFENDPALWSNPFTRPVFDQNGSQGVGSLSGNWANVDDRFGMIVRGGSGMSIDEIADTQTGKVDITNPLKRLNGATGGTNQSRAALVLPLASRQATARVTADARQATVSDSGWAAMTARSPDNSGRIAVARWAGSQTATVSGMTSGWGAPIADRPVDITVGNVTAGNHSSGSMSHTFSPTDPASVGWEGYFWVDAVAGSATNSVTVRPISETRIKLTNGATATTVTVRYTDGTGAAHRVTKPLAAGEVAYAQGLDQGVVLVTPSATSVQSSSFPAALAYDGNTSSSNNWWASASTTISAGSPQHLTLDLGRPVDLAGVTMTPVSGAGPKDYAVQTSTDGSTWATPGGGAETGVGNSARTTTFTSAQLARYVRLQITASNQTGSPTQVKVRELAVNAPAIDIDAIDPLRAGADPRGQIRLAKGGFNQVTVRVRNNTGTAKSVTVARTVTSPITATIVEGQPVSVPANGFTDVHVSLSGSTATTGTGTLTLSGTVSGATIADEAIDLLLGDQDLALNDTGTTFPKATATSFDPAWIYGAELANDGDTTSANNFWVSGPAMLSTEPQDLIVDFGATINVRRIEMTPRWNGANLYGPRDYLIQTSTSATCASGAGFATPAGGTVTNADDNGETSTTLTNATNSARCVRLHVTAGWGVGPPTQVQVRELQIYPT